jgi:hypothetical protein
MNRDHLNHCPSADVVLDLVHVAVLLLHAVLEEEGPAGTSIPSAFAVAIGLKNSLIADYAGGITDACGVTWVMFATSSASVPPAAQVIAPASIF